MLVFVYGTLKFGYPNNTILSTSRFLCEDIVQGFELKYSGYPVANPSESSCVLGEVWDIGEDENVLQNLDWLEGVPTLYTREVVTTEGGLVCSMYVGNPQSFEFDYMDNCLINSDGYHYWQPLGRRLPT